MSARFVRNRLRGGWWWVVLVVAVLLRLGYHGTDDSTATALAEGRHRVARVVDGDTLLLDSGARVRLQGIDTPETVRPDHPVEPWGPEATQFVEQFVQRAGYQVELTFSAERLDQYGRYLAFVWHDDLLLNEELVRAGLAEARLGYRYSGIMKRRLAAAQEQAQAQGRGIWSDQPTNR